MCENESDSVVSDSLQPHGLQHTRPPCPSPSPGACSNSCPLSQWCHPTISYSVVPSSSCLPAFNLFSASGSFPVRQLFPSGGQRNGASASASVLPMNIQCWFPLRLTGLISLLSKGLSRAFFSHGRLQESSRNSVRFEQSQWKHQFFGAQPSLWPNSHICTRLLGKP